MSSISKVSNRKKSILKHYETIRPQWGNARLSQDQVGKQVDSNPSDCKKYNENINCLGTLFFILFIIKILFVFLQWLSDGLKLIFGIIYFKNYCLYVCQYKHHKENIAYSIFYTEITRLLQYFINTSDRFRNILSILQYFEGIFLQYFLNISVLCWLYTQHNRIIFKILANILDTLY